MLHSSNTFLCDGVCELARGSLEAVLERSNTGYNKKETLRENFQIS